MVRAVDLDIKPGVETDMGDGDEWPPMHEKLLASEILVHRHADLARAARRASPSACSSAWTRCSPRPTTTDRPVAYNRVAGVVVTGNEDGAHHVISEISGALIDIGYTIPGQAWTYWNKGRAPATSTSSPTTRTARSGRTARPGRGAEPGLRRARSRR